METINLKVFVIRKGHTEHRDHILKSRNWVIFETSLYQSHVHYVVDVLEVFRELPHYV